VATNTVGHGPTDIPASGSASAAVDIAMKRLNYKLASFLTFSDSLAAGGKLTGTHRPMWVRPLARKVERNSTGASKCNVQLIATKSLSENWLHFFISRFHVRFVISPLFAAIPIPPGKS
jgi:hypothetical protein